VRITYSVRVNAPMSGDRSMVNAITGPDSNCPCAITTRVVPELASTGSSVRGLAVGGALLVLLGTGIVVAAARRRSRDAKG
jgi:LPXTG-motif cell wall-anchored protein